MLARGDLHRSLDHPDFDSGERRTSPGSGQPFAKLCGALFHESLDTLILGALSTSLGVVLILATLRETIGSGIWIDLPLSTYFALVPIGTSIGVVGIVRARVLKRFTSPLSTLGAVLCFTPAAPQILGSVGIYLLITAPFAILFYGSVIAEKLLRRLVRKHESNDEDSNADDRDRGN
jgi:hypothetical protein